MNKAGFLRLAAVICGIAWLFIHYFLTDSRTIGDPHIRHLGRIAIECIAGWGIVTLLASRLRR